MSQQLISIGAAANDGTGDNLRTAGQKINSNFAELYATAAPFNPAITFNGRKVLPRREMATAVAFTVDSTDQFPFGGTYATLVANGVNVPTFAGMQEWGGSSGYDNTVGVVNRLEFFFDGDDYFYSISQAINGARAPYITGMAGNPGSNTITLTYSLALAAGAPASSAYTISSNGAAISISNVAVSGTQVTLTLSRNLAGGEAITLGYTAPSSNPVRSSAGVSAGSFSGVSVPLTQTLGALTFSSASFVIGTASSGTINGATAGSTITASGLPTGVTINSAARTWAYDGTGTVTSGNITLTETLAGATGSPRNSTVAYTVANAPATLGALTLSNTTPSATAAWTATINGRTSGSTITATSSDGTTLTVSGSTVSGTFASTGTPTVTLTETLAGATNTPRTSTVNLTVGAAPTQQLMRYTVGSGTTETVNGSGGYDYFKASANWGQSSVGQVSIPSGQDGFFGFTMPATPFGAGAGILGSWIGVSTSDASLASWSNLAAGIYGGENTQQLWSFTSGSLSTAGASTADRTVAAGDVVRIRRTGGTLFVEVSKNGGASYVVIASGTAPSGQLFAHIFPGQSGYGVIRPFASLNAA